MSLKALCDTDTLEFRYIFTNWAKGTHGDDLLVDFSD
jgi:hypothetical protein